MTTEDILSIGGEHHTDMVLMGWSDAAKSDDHYKMLIVGEVCEAIQAHRKGMLRGVTVECLSDTDFMSDFEAMCKDTVEDEMADAFLRMLSLYWMRGLDVTYPLEGWGGGAVTGRFTEDAMRLTRILSREGDLQRVLDDAIGFVLSWAESMEMDLLGACRRKMRYNRLREDWKNNVKRY